jgi:hypothetical protein
MKKLIFYSITTCIALFIILFAVSGHIGPPALQMKTLSLSQRLIPIFYIHPKDRIVAYIDNANDLFALAEKLVIQNPTIALESTFRAEHDMTLMVSELRRLPDTSIISYSLLFDTFNNQYSYLSGIPNNNTDISQYAAIKTFAQQNEITAIYVYYSRLPPQVSVGL